MTFASTRTKTLASMIKSHVLALLGEVRDYENMLLQDGAFEDAVDHEYGFWALAGGRFCFGRGFAREFAHKFGSFLAAPALTESDSDAEYCRRAFKASQELRAAHVEQYGHKRWLVVPGACVNNAARVDKAELKRLRRRNFQDREEHAQMMQRLSREDADRRQKEVEEERRRWLAELEEKRQSASPVDDAVPSEPSSTDSESEFYETQRKDADERRLQTCKAICRFVAWCGETGHDA